MTTTFDPAATDTHEPVPTTGEPTSDTTSDTSSDTSSDSGEVAECGNGQVERGEECDDGNSVDFDACTNACIVAFCGDSVVQPSLGEQCDGQANLPDHTICPDGGNCALSCYQDRNVTYVLCEGDDITMDGCKLAENC